MFAFCYFHQVSLYFAKWKYNATKVSPGNRTTAAQTVG